MYFVVLAIFLAGFVLIYRTIHSPFGQVLKAIRENEPRAISLGYRTERYKLVAFVMSRLVVPEAEILSIAVAAPQRRHGLAHRLLDLHLQRIGELGVRTVFLEVDESNEAARRLYGRFGFSNVGRRPGYYPQTGTAGASALVLRRDVA